jgi:hypothetical protein
MILVLGTVATHIVGAGVAVTPVGTPVVAAAVTLAAGAILGEVMAATQGVEVEILGVEVTLGVVEVAAKT